MLELVALRLGHTLERGAAVGAAVRSVEGGLLALGVALEARDVETAGHTERVVELAARLGEALGLSGDDTQALRGGAYLHDIGKLTIPDGPLRKPGALTVDERELMQTHAARIEGLPERTLGVIRSHHERWDGTGSPDRRRGDQIPLLARVFAVCDVYDALTSERPYKSAWSHERALAEVERQAGRHFDPAVVRAFLRVMTRDVPDGAREEPEVVIDSGSPAGPQPSKSWRPH